MKFFSFALAVFSVFHLSPPLLAQSKPSNQLETLPDLLEVESPQHQLHINQNKVTVSGACTDGVGITIKGGGVKKPWPEAIECQSGQFNTDVNLTDGDGSKYIRVLQISQLLNRRSITVAQSLSVRVDTKIPAVSITSHSGDEVMEINQQFYLEGLCEKNLDLLLTGEGFEIVETKTIKCRYNNTFKLSLKLLSNATLNIAQVDKAGNRGQVSDFQLAVTGPAPDPDPVPTPKPDPTPSPTPGDDDNDGGDDNGDISQTPTNPWYVRYVAASENLLLFCNPNTSSHFNEQRIDYYGHMAFFDHYDRFHDERYLNCGKALVEGYFNQVEQDRAGLGDHQLKPEGVYEYYKRFGASPRARSVLFNLAVNNTSVPSYGRVSNPFGLKNGDQYNGLHTTITRPVAYVTRGLMLAERAGFAVPQISHHYLGQGQHSMKDAGIRVLLHHFQESYGVQVSGIDYTNPSVSTYNQPFMMGISARTLILEHESTQDEALKKRIQKAIIASADNLIERAWEPNSGFGRFTYDYCVYQGAHRPCSADGNSGNDAGAEVLIPFSGLIMAFAYHASGDAKYLNALDTAMTSLFNMYEHPGADWWRTDAKWEGKKTGQVFGNIGMILKYRDELTPIPFR